jgi:hypothetical protein
MTPEERRQIVYQLEAIVGGARLVLDTNLKHLRQEQRGGLKCDPLVTSLTLVDGTLRDAEQGLKTIAKWEAE